MNHHDGQSSLILIIDEFFLLREIANARLVQHDLVSRLSISQCNQGVHWNDRMIPLTTTCTKINFQGVHGGRLALN